MNTTASTIHSTVPVIATDDIRRSISYYKETLGFAPDFEYGDPLVYAGVKAGEAEIYFTYDPDFARTIKDKHLHPEVFIWLADADSLFAVHLASGAQVVESIADRPWGCRQYVIKEINGYYLKFAQPLQ